MADVKRTTVKDELLVVGAGGLGCAVLPLLAAEGWALTVWDDDHVSLSNLQRQVLFRDEDLGKPKAEIAAKRVRALVPGARITPKVGRLSPENIAGEVGASRLVLDGSDNFATRFLVNDACVLERTPLIHGGILRFLGQVMAIVPGRTACYRCLFEAPPPEGSVPSCAEAGVLGALCGVVGAAMVEAASALLRGEAAEGGLLLYDALAARQRFVPLERDPGCAVCGDTPQITALEPEHYQSAEVVA